MAEREGKLIAKKTVTEGQLEGKTSLRRARYGNQRQGKQGKK